MKVAHGLWSSCEGTHAPGHVPKVWPRLSGSAKSSVFYSSRHSDLLSTPLGANRFELLCKAFSDEKFINQRKSSRTMC